MEEFDDIIDLDIDSPDKKHPIASHGKRLVNVLVDGIILSILNNSISTIIVPQPEFVYDSNFGNYSYQAVTDWNMLILSFVLSILLQVFTYTLMEQNLQGRSIAKFLTRTKVLSKDHTTPTFKQIHIRSWCRLIPFEAFSFLGKKPTGWHDTLSKTIVVDESKFL